MAMTLATLRTLVRQLVGDPQGSTYSPEMYQDAINFACKEYAKKTGVTYIETPVEMDTYDGTCTIPTAYMRINRVMTGAPFVFGVFILDDGGARTSVSIGTGVETTPAEYDRYLAYGNCLVFPSATATASIKDEIIPIYDTLGVILAYVEATSVLSILRVVPNFDLLESESCFGASIGELSSGYYADFTMIATCNGVTGQIKMRYIQPNL